MGSLNSPNAPLNFSRMAPLWAVLMSGYSIGLAAPAIAFGAPQASAAGEPKTFSGRKLALIIGNNKYKNSPLTNPVNDATAMARTLRDLGFLVTALTDATLAQMTDAARQFGDNLGRGDVGLFYFAGHGMQIKGRNFLIPIDADILREDELQYKSFDANQMLDKMESAHNPINIVILDACRNNPFARSFRSSTTGLAQMDAPVGSYISFSTGPGKVASDGKGENGLFTQHLLKALRTPDLKVEDVFKQVRRQVMQESKGIQVPWDSSSLTGDFYFLPGESISAPQVARPVAPETAAPPRIAAADTPLKGNNSAPPQVAAQAETKKPALATPPVPTAAKTREVALATEAFHKGQEAQKRGDAKVALEHFGLAAENGNSGAQFELAQLYKFGRPPAHQDMATARKWFAKAAEQGVILAQYELGKLCALGQGGSKNCREAEKWLRKAADRTHLDAMVQLAWVYQGGCDGEKNSAEAARWLKLAAGKGSRDAQFSLGVLYFKGEGVPKDPKEARKWLEAAAAQGHPSTKLYLSHLQ